jgi:uncharacterized protein
VPARQGRAVQIARGQALKIINTSGHQVVDFWAFHTTDARVFLSMEHTRSTLSRLTPRVGDTLVDNRREPMVMFEADDSPGVHDTIIAPCDRYRYEKLGCVGVHNSCADNLTRALASLEISLPACPSSFNLWMNIPADQAGNLQWLPPVAKPGDGVVFRALVDCVMVMSACPQDIIPINAKRPVSAHYAVI